ncbi:hypothetical protein VNI00_007500 [Paramarasmius palmivorus]|uniref:Uncharacterized protein n=1 Tax=Paramarasmius palmivorus TaxID=297713 RepID=A0AAW0D3R0_9AGAR
MRALSRAESAQGFNKYYSACIPDNVDLLTPEERNVELLTEAEQEILARMIAEGPGTRKQYVDLVLGYYQLDIYYLFSNSPDDLESRLEMYNRCDPFTPEEQNFLRDAIGKIAVDPVMRNRVRDSAKGYRCPVKLEDHMKATELYLQRVENDVSALKAMFRE